MDRLTYSLSGDNKVNSDKYYETVAIFTEEVLREAKKIVVPIVKVYNDYFNKVEDKKSNEIDEGVLELLILGVLIRVYYPRVRNFKKIQYKLLTWVISIRKGNDNLKPAMNNLKGILSTLFLLSKAEYNIDPIDLNMKQFKKLILWLEASGEFSREVQRIKKWEKYLNTLSKKESLDVLTEIYNFALWFENRSNEILGQYTMNVDKYLKEVKNTSNWREDIILRQRARVEYHLNMVGAEIMNKVFRKDFIGTDKKAILLPICMTSPSKDFCKSEGFGKDFKCKGCSNKCQVNKLTVLGEKLGFTVMIVPHESSISSESRNYTLFDEDTGVVGVACVLNLISGGWLLQEMNIPAQCVLLDYCGCKNHWHHEGISTCINLNKLHDILSKRNEAF